jgi:NADH dehydrogenase [ubiquinone] 1 alpha subcomplex assembly factor 7
VTEQRTPLDDEIRARIARSGPMRLDEFMALCLYDPQHGYYSSRLPFGAAGDFITAPEISQMFGEMVAVWAVEAWVAMGMPSRFALIECGPGRGTMMKDMLRATRTFEGFRKGVEVHLVETSAGLQARQRETLDGVGDVPLHWHAGIDGVPAIPSIVVANEYFDALPVRQAERRADGWHERVVTVDACDALKLSVACDPLCGLTAPPAVAAAPDGAVFEWRPGDGASAIARRAAAGGAALLIDYGHFKSEAGDTLQAVRAHRYANPLASPGLADLTAHVDFEALGRAAREAGARVHGPVEQGTWLQRMGIEVRAAMLQANADGNRSAGIAEDLLRLTGTGPNQMGALFKTIAFSAPEIGQLPGFDPGPAEPGYTHPGHPQSGHLQSGHPQS